MTDATPYICLARGGRLDIEDVERALNGVIAQFVSCGDAVLLGSDALRFEIESGFLRIEHACARARSGRRWLLRGSDLPLPPVEGEGETAVRIGINWHKVPVADGSSVLLDAPCARLLDVDEAGEDGELFIGFWNGEALRPVPVPAENVTSTAANLLWRDQQQGALRDLDQMLKCLEDRLQATNASLLPWQHLLSGVWRAISDAEKELLSGSMARITGALESCARSFHGLPAKAADAGEAEILELVSCFAPGDAAAGEASECLHERCESIVRDLDQLKASMADVLVCAGVAIRSLPGRLYHRGRMYSLVERLVVDAQGAGQAGSTSYTFAGARGDEGLPMAVVWETTRPVFLGELRSFHGCRDTATRRDEKYLSPIEGTDYHWLDSSTSSSTRIEAPNDVRLVEAGVYEPVVH